MSEPKLTVGRVATWRPIDAENVLFRAGLQDDHIRSQRAAGYVRAAMRELVRELNGRLVLAPAPQPEARAEPVATNEAITHNIGVAAPDYTCPRCGGVFAPGNYTCKCPAQDAIAAANARIAELVRERDEAYRKGVAAAKEACAKRFLDEADAHSNDGNPIWFTLSQMSARIVRETEVPGP